MHPSSFASLVMSGSAELYGRELMREVERDALIKAARSGKRSVFAQVRLAVGQFMVVSGRWIAGRPRRQRPLDVPIAFKIAR